MKNKQFKCKDEVIYRFKAGLWLGHPEPWTYGIFSHYNKDGSFVINGNSYQGIPIDILPYKGNEHLVGTTDEPQIPLLERERQDTYWNSCTQLEKAFLRESYNDFLKEDVKGRSILEDLCGKHNLQDEPEEEIKLEEGEWIMVNDKIDLFPCNWELRYFGYTDETRFRAYYTELQIATRSSRTIKWKYAIRFSDFNPYDMEETKKHILYIKNGKVVRYKW